MTAREQVADLQPGDVVEVSWPGDRPDEGVTITVRGPLRLERRRDGSNQLILGGFVVRYATGDSALGRDRTLTVVSRAPRRLYVNHPRTEPVPGDVVRDADVAEATRIWMWTGKYWHGQTGNDWRLGTIPPRLRLLVDGETGQVVP